MGEKSSTDSSPTPPPDGAYPDRLPFSGWWALLAGALAGLAMRFVFFGKAGSNNSAMMAAFIYVSPVVVGAITVYVAERRRRRTWAYYAWAPALANVIYVLGTLLVYIEGIVCAIVILPLFAVLGALSGLLMGVVCRVTNWPKQTLLSIGVLPLVLGFVESGVPLPDRIGIVERTTAIGAPPNEVWRQIINAPNIKAAEVNGAWLFRMGVPVPLAGATQQTADGPVRKVTMGKGIYFDEVITDLQENRYVHWLYRFHEDSFPPNTLDEHVVIGGQYFDLRSTSYTLTPTGTQTELKVRMQYRVSTRFNWYADPVARFLIGNVAEINLDYFRHRSESARNAETLR